VYDPWRHPIAKGEPGNQLTLTILSCSRRVWTPVRVQKRVARHPAEPDVFRIRELGQADLHALMAQGGSVEVATEQAIPEGEQAAVVAVGLALILRVMGAVHLRCDEQPPEGANKPVDKAHLRWRIARLPRPQAGTRTGTLRGSRLARVSSSRQFVHRRLWILGLRTPQYQSIERLLENFIERQMLTFPENHVPRRSPPGAAPRSRLAGDSAPSTQRSTRPTPRTVSAPRKSKPRKTLMAQ